MGPACHPAAPLVGWLMAMKGRHGHGPWERWGSPGEGGPGRGFGAGFGAGPGFGPPWMRGRGPKARRGDVRAAILSVLADQSMNGYQIIQQIADRTDGSWKPSPGSIYPTLQQLEDEGLVFADTGGGRRTYALTDDGRTYVAEHPDEIAAPWKAFDEVAGDGSDVRPLIGQVAAATWQIMAVGTPEQQERGREALAELRRTLYGILAEDDETGSSR
jgi:DNA-binding PadR family transcriptional regulator